MRGSRGALGRGGEACHRGKPRGEAGGPVSARSSAVNPSAPAWAGARALGNAVALLRRWRWNPSSRRPRPAYARRHVGPRTGAGSRPLEWGRRWAAPRRSALRHRSLPDCWRLNSVHDLRGRGRTRRRCRCTHRSTRASRARPQPHWRVGCARSVESPPPARPSRPSKRGHSKRAVHILRSGDETELLLPPCRRALLPMFAESWQVPDGCC